MKIQTANKTITVHKQTWFGIKGFIEIHAGIFHRAGLGNVIILHPPLINWLLRIGLNEETDDALNITHEFGHLQTFPLAVIYLLLITYLAASRKATSWPEVLFLLVSIHAAWEIMAEGFTKLSSGKLYRLYYTGVSIVPRMIFWAVTIGLTIGGWILVVF